jgi:hypothetical protein
MSDTAPTVVQQNDIPGWIRGLVTDPDYVDLFAAPVPDATNISPERWARAAIEEAPAAGRFLAWRVLCGLRLERQHSPTYIAGWKIADRGDNWIKLEASSSLMTANMTFQVEEGLVSFATFIRYDRPIARLVWTPVSAIHRAVAPGFLHAAVRRVDRSR